MSTYITFRHKADIYAQTRIVSNSGQKKATWQIETSSQKCDFLPKYSNIRIRPTQEDMDTITMYFPSEAILTTDKRVYNIVDRFNQTIDNGPFEIVGIDRETGFTGALHHYVCRLKRVVE